MSDLADKIAQVICEDRAVDNWQTCPSDYDLAQAIIDALPGLVKPLEWGEEGTWGSQPSYHADSAFGWLMLVDHTQHGNGFRVYPPWEEPEEKHPTLEAAIAAAQADYTRRILAAFGVEP